MLVNPWEVMTTPRKDPRSILIPVFPVGYTRPSSPLRHPRYHNHLPLPAIQNKPFSAHQAFEPRVVKLRFTDGSHVDTTTSGLTVMIGGPSGSSIFKRNPTGITVDRCTNLCSNRQDIWVPAMSIRRSRMSCCHLTGACHLWREGIERLWPLPT